MSQIVGVDVGGTFTDVFVLDEAAGTFRVAKVPTTRADQSAGFIEGLAAGAGDLAGIATVVHGTTVATNTLLERNGAVTGTITTQGFRDVLEMRRRDRPRTWGLAASFEPIVPRDLRCEVPERTLADGSVRTPVDLDAVRDAAERLKRAGCEAVSLFFVNAYANANNERAAVEVLRQVWPNAYVNASHEILPEIREFERASTTAINAYLQPVVARYLERLEQRLGDAGAAPQILIVQSNGGVMSVPTARRLPVRTALSGPAAGVIAGAEIARQAGYGNVVTCDMGGTSFDVSLVAGGQSILAAQTAIDFGLVVRTPMIEITTIGAGGGSIAWVDKGGMLQVGPQSAGAEPGPVCYGQGGTRATVTDANVVLGRINADRPIGGKLTRLDVAAARRAIDDSVGAHLGLDTDAAAEAIVRVANARMAGAIRLVSIERGYDPEDFLAMPFGGGGALHCGALIREVGLAKALVPRFPGVTSALGCVIADMRHDFVATVHQLLSGLEVGELADQMRGMLAQGAALLDRAGVAFAGRRQQIELDMSYVGQTHTVAVPIEADEDGDLSADAIRLAFERRYQALYGRLLRQVPVRVLNLRVAVVGERPGLDLALLAPPADASLKAARRPGRRVYADGGWHEAAVYDRLALPVGARVVGPAVLEQPDTTTFVDPGLVAEVDRLGNLVISREAV
jgi:N-methylhydantoinase A